MKVVLISALKNDFDRQLASVFLQEGYRVYAAGDKPMNGLTLLSLDLKKAADVIKKNNGYIDIYIDVTDEHSENDNFNVRSGLKDDVIRKLYEANVIRSMAMLEAFLPLLEAGEGKRLCYLSSAQASINEARGTDGLGYKMAKAALHNFLQITHNVLAPKGYTIRVFDAVSHEVSAKQSAAAAFSYFTRKRGMERGDPLRNDEGNLVLRDALGRQHAW